MYQLFKVLLVIFISFNLGILLFDQKLNYGNGNDAVFIFFSAIYIYKHLVYYIIIVKVGKPNIINIHETVIHELVIHENDN